MDRNSLVSIIIVTHDSEQDIVECINSVLGQDYRNIEIIVVDNQSKDSTVDIIAKQFGPSAYVKLFQNNVNNGYAGGNNLGFKHARGELIVILNPDLVVDKDWLVELLEAYDKHEDAGVLCSNVLLFDDHSRINACGNEIHLTGLVFSRNYGKDECECREESVPAPSGASMLVSRANLTKIGRDQPFDDTRFIMEYSDIDLALDFSGCGMCCYVVPTSRVFHKFKFKMNPQRLLILEKGRYEILGHFRRRTLLLMLSALILTELIVWSYVTTKDRRLFGSKLNVATWYVMNANRIFRKGNSRDKDVRLLRQLKPEMSIYSEMFDQSSATLSKMMTFANSIYGTSKNFVLYCLGSRVK